MARTIRVQSDSNAHDRPWRVAVEQGFFAEEGLDVVYHEDNPQGTEGRVKDFAHHWKETQLQQGAWSRWGAAQWWQTAARSPTCGGAAASSPGRISMRKPRRSCGARSTARSPGCGRMRNARERNSCAT